MRDAQTPIRVAVERCVNTCLFGLARYVVELHKQLLVTLPKSVYPLIFGLKLTLQSLVFLL